MANPLVKANTDYNDIYFNDSDGVVSGNLLANDVNNLNGNALSVAFFDEQRVGAASKGGAFDFVGEYGTFHVLNNGSYTYTLDKTDAEVAALTGNQTLTERVSYKITAGSGQTDFDYLLVTIHGQNHKPLAVDDFDTAINGHAAGNVLTNDVDAEGGLFVARTGATPDLHFVDPVAGLLVEGKYGTLEIHRDGTYTYDVNLSDADYLALNGTASDNFSYREGDGAFGSVPNNNSTDVGILHIAVEHFLV